MRRGCVVAVAVALCLAPAAARAEVRSVLFGGAVEPLLPAPAFALTLPAPGTAARLGTDDGLLAARISGVAPRAPQNGQAPRPQTERPRRMPAVLDAARARLLLRSLTLPGWGQATSGHRTAAATFGMAEVGVWTSFTAFRIQQVLRRQGYERLARIFAGIDLRGRDEEYRRTVGAYLSSDDYNRYVVFRDAANLYYNDPVLYRAYIAEHSITGADAWSWGSVEDLMHYRSMRKDEQRAGLRANTALALAVANRLVSMVHAARIAGRPSGPPHAWNLECVPTGGDDPTAYRLQVRARF
jgi:hypothetical protein